MTQTQLSSALEYVQNQQERFQEDLKAFVKIPSISTDPNAKADIRRAADYIAGRLKGLGFQKVEVLPTKGSPVVCGELMSAGAGKPTVLIYGHFDVQPVEPLELWLSPAFEATRRGDNLYGRGTSDMKGQLIIVLAAIEALAKSGGMPVNLKVIFEGEEEVGSPNLEQFIIEHKDRLAADFAINPDSGMIGEQIPTITYGLRGLAYLEIRLQGPAHDLHSGSYGGAVHNPAQVLCELVAGMHDAQGRVTLPGFYDRVRKLEDDERKELARLPMGEAFYLEQTGAPALYGEAGYSVIERVCARPTLEVNGLLSGFTGEGQKTVLPAKAMAKISMRLVPDQDPEEVRQQMAKYLEEHTPSTVHWELIKHAGSFASITDCQIAAVTAMSQALEQTWGKRPVFKREGGSIPVVVHLRQHLGIESVLIGFGLPDDNLHAPNEKIHLPTFYRGIETMVRYFNILGEK
jgi:acetylornithine deacetylase/succinyl-diaminopimelate desuccinylase-like protein